MCICVLGTMVSCAKTAEPIATQFGEQTHVDAKNFTLDSGPQEKGNHWGGDMCWPTVKYREYTGVEQTETHNTRSR